MSTEQRFYITKPSGSERASVIDRETGLMMQRFNIFKTYHGLDGWAAADRYCKRLNERAARAAASMAPLTALAVKTQEGQEP